MRTDSVDAPSFELIRIVLPVFAVSALALAWVALTAETGLTYHLAPGVVAAVPGYWLAWSGGRPPPKLMEAVITLAGLGLVAAGWAVLELMNATPTATFVEGQPGGVGGETAVVALLGAVLALRAMRRAGRDVGGI